MNVYSGFTIPAFRTHVTIVKEYLLPCSDVGTILYELVIFKKYVKSMCIELLKVCKLMSQDGQDIGLMASSIFKSAVILVYLTFEQDKFQHLFSLQ
jgi:hypothetical protein